MFNKKFNDVNAFSNLIAAGTNVSGTILFSGVLKIGGNVSGNLISAIDEDTTKKEFTVIIDESGTVESDEINCKMAVISGKCFAKKIWIENSLKITKSAHISNATIYYRDLTIEPGAMLNNCVLKQLDFCSEGEKV